VGQQSEAFKALPAIEKLLKHEDLLRLAAAGNLAYVKQEARYQVAQLRSQIALNDKGTIAWVLESDIQLELIIRIAQAVSCRYSNSLAPVFNLTGTIIHTNLGRARLPVEAVAAMEVAATGDINIEYDLETGKRGDRDDHLEQVICGLTGAEAATVVNNNAAAVMLVLNSLAQEREVIISRGELVEIGGAFRIPDVMKSANCILREVGTTNRTHARDYREAVNEQTALMMRVHTSNYEIKGFIKAVSDEELSKIAHETGVVFVSDLGSGTLVELTQYGLPKEPTVRETLDMGADLVTFSGDKLLGGPQAGIIVGRADLISQLKRNQLKRALRVDKITMAALLAVLDLYRNPEQLRSRLPLLRDLTRPAEEIEQVCRRILPELEKSLANRAKVGVNSCKSQIGSGSLPLDLLESYCLSIKPVALKGERDASLLRLAQAFRQLPKPVVGRVHDGKLLLDLRCLRDEYDFIQQLNQLEI
jgi:L-seryl-tRNA(Ser) seleniumtransferase